MRVLLLVVSPVLALPCHATERQFWGPTLDGLRLSVTLVITTMGLPIPPGPALRLTIANVGKVERHVLLGGISDVGPQYATLHFAASSPEGKRWKMLYSGTVAVGDYARPMIASVMPNKEWVIELPLTIFWIAGGLKESLKQLIDTGWAVEASIEVTPGEVTPGEVTPEAGSWSPSRWTGKLVSGKMRY